MTFSLTNLKFSIPTAIKWTIFADFIALGAMTLQYIPSTIWGIPTLPVVTVVSAVLATWEAYAIKQESSATVVTAVTTSVPPATVTTTTVSKPTPPKPVVVPGFSLDSNASAPKVGDTFILSVAKGTPNGTFTIYETDNNQPVTTSWALDANGNGGIRFAPLTTVTPIGAVINMDGGISIQAKDSAGLVSNTIVLG